MKMCNLNRTKFIDEIQATKRVIDVLVIIAIICFGYAVWLGWKK